MNELELHTWLVRAELFLAVPIALALLFIRAPYGRHARAGWGPTISASAGWAIMESSALITFGLVFVSGERAWALAPLLTAMPWLVHYGHRAILFPLALKAARPMPLSVVAMGFTFNLLNGYTNGRFLGGWGAHDPEWLADPRFGIGTLIFLLGLAINLTADRKLISLRRSGEYRIPQGGLFRFVSCPNYLGEIVEWLGFAILTWSLPALAFLAFTMANLVPRAIAHHRWYRERFEDYPKARRAVVPFVL